MTQISQLPAATSAGSTDIIPATQTGTTRGLTVAQILAGPTSAINIESARALAAEATKLDASGGDSSATFAALLQSNAGSRTLAQHLGDTLSVLSFIQPLTDYNPLTGATIVGTTIGSVLTVTSVTSGQIQLGAYLGTTGVYITSLASGSGGAGSTYNLSAAPASALSGTLVLASLATFTGSVTNGVLTVSAVTAGNIAVGHYLGITGAYIASLGTGTGGVGTYNLGFAPFPGASTAATLAYAAGSALNTTMLDIGLAIQRAHDAANGGDRLILPGAPCGQVTASLFSTSGTSVYAWTMFTGVNLAKNVLLHTSALINAFGAINCFTLPFDHASVNGLTFVGCAGVGMMLINAQVNVGLATAYVASGSGWHISQCQIERVAYGLTVPANTGGYEGTYRDIRMRNIGVSPINAQGGVGHTVDNIVYDTDYAYTSGANAGQVQFLPPSGPGIAYAAQGYQFVNIEMLHCGTQGGLKITPNLYATPNVGTFTTFFVTCQFDTAINGPGIWIDNETPASGAGSLKLYGMYFIQCWSATNLQNIKITGTGPIEQIVMDGTIVTASQADALFTSGNCTDVHLNDCQFKGNATRTNIWAGTAYSAVPPSAPTLTLESTGDIRIRGGRIASVAGGVGVTGNPTTHIQTVAGSGIVDIDGLTMDTPSSGNQVTIGGPAGNFMIGRNPGLMSRARSTVAVAAGATSATFAHGLFTAPMLSEVTLTPGSNLGSIGYYLGNLTATQATVYLTAAPSAAVGFGWAAEIDAR